MSAAVKSSGVLKGWHVLLILLGFFGSVMAVNVVFVVAAVRSFPGEEEQHAYMQGVRYNETIAARAAQAARGWTATIDAGGGFVRIRFRDRAGTGLDGLAVAGALRRPTTAREDVALRFVDRGAGLYEADVSAARKGLWEIRAEAKDAAGRSFEIEQHVVLR